MLGRILGISCILCLCRLSIHLLLSRRLGDWTPTMIEDYRHYYSQWLIWMLLKAHYGGTNIVFYCLRFPLITNVIELFAEQVLRMVLASLRISTQVFSSSAYTAHRTPIKRLRLRGRWSRSTWMAR